jgi:hypothetical protein
MFVNSKGMGTQVRKKRKPEISKDRNQMDSSREEMMFVNAPDIPEINHRLRDYLYQGLCICELILLSKAYWRRRYGSNSGTGGTTHATTAGRF